MAASLTPVRLAAAGALRELAERTLPPAHEKHPPRLPFRHSADGRTALLAKKILRGAGFPKPHCKFKFRTFC